MTILTSYLLLILLTLIALSVLQKLLFRLLTNKIGYRSVYVSAIIGTPIHELSHAIMCFLFGHKIIQIKFFSPDKKGTLGFVTHSYNNRNAWQVLGNFFIGVAPILGGSVCLYLLCFLLLPSGVGVLDILLKQTDFLKNGQVLPEIQNLLSSLKSSMMNDIETKPLQTLIWAYLCGSIALHMCPSKEDIKGSLWGFLLFISFVLIFIAIVQVYTVNLSAFIVVLTSISHILFMMLIFALICALFLFILISLVSMIFNILFPTI